MAIDFARVAADVLARAETLVPQWLPAGKRRGREYVVGNLRGDAGDSLSVNLDTGLWADFATGEKGGDLVSLYAAIHGLSQADAARELDARAGEWIERPPPPAPPRVTRRPAVIDAPAERPPPDVRPPPPHPRWGSPAALYAYHDAQGLVGYVARYEPPDERKQFCPWRWQAGRWSPRALPKPRPLYRTERLLQRPDATVVVTEGEKAADAAQRLLPDAVAVTWPGGAQAVTGAQWDLLAGREVLLWPDADEPGRQAMATLVPILQRHGATVSVVRPDGQPEGWDAADALAAGWTTRETMDWMQDRIVHYGSPVPPDEADDSVSSSLARTTAAPAGPGPDKPAADWHDAQVWQWYGLDLQDRGRMPANNEDTCCRVLARHAESIYYDEFLQRAMTTWGGTEPHPIGDADIAAMLVFLQRDVRLRKMSRSTLEHALHLIYAQRRRNCAREWLESLAWDGTARIHLLMTHGFGARESDYHRAVGRNLMMAMVHRVLEPGCKWDYVPILEGPQGRMKSTGLSVLGGEYFAECHESLSSGKEFYQLLQGKMLIELSELHAMSRAEAERVKGIITARYDRYRAPYGRIAQDYARTCVFVGTTNRDDWNRDDTGARRFWRVLVGDVDLEWIAREREQLFAEAVHRVKAGEPHFQVPEAEAQRLQKDAMARDAWHDPVMAYASRFDEVRPEDILRDALNVPIERHDNPSIARVRSILRVEGWRTTTTKRHGQSVRVWRRPSIADAPGLPTPPPSDTGVDADSPAAH